MQEPSALTAVTALDPQPGERVLKGQRIGGADGKHGLEEYLQTQVVYLETDI